VNSAGNIIGKTMPPGSIETIQSVRYDTMKALLDECYRKFDAILASPKSCRDAGGRGDVCHVSIIGSLVRGFHQLGLSHRPDAVNVRGSIEDLSESLMNMPIYAPDWNLSSGDGHHEQSIHADCIQAARLADSIREILHNIPSAVLNSHRNHMDEQAKQ